MINLVIFNGGRGAATIIPALKEIDDIKITSIVNAYDDGKSTGEIREFFEMLGPSDIRKAQQLMLPTDHKDFRSINFLFDLRFSKKLSSSKILTMLEKECNSRSKFFFDNKFNDDLIIRKIRFFLKIFLRNYELISNAIPSKKLNLRDCSLMNCLYAGAYIHCERNIEFTAIEFEKIFNLNGTVLPTSIENKKLVGLRSNGEVLFSEADIVELRSNVGIERVYLVENYPPRGSFKQMSMTEKKEYFESHHSFVEASPRAQRAIKDADIIVYSAGTQHSSLYPTYLANGISDCIANNTRALKAFITNIGADYETPFYKAHDYINGALNYLNLGSSIKRDIRNYFNLMLVNKFDKSNDSYVKIDQNKLRKIPIKKIIAKFENADSGKHDGHLVTKTLLSELSDHLKRLN